MDHKNPLYPVFLKAHQLHFLIIGAGKVAREKLFFLLKSSPDSRVTLVAPEIIPELEEMVVSSARVDYISKKFDPSDVDGKDVILAAGTPAVNRYVWEHAKQKGKLINVADTPDLCDFYLGSIVTKGPLKIGISTNGLSPSFAKRFREWLEENLPDNIPSLLRNLHLYRKQLKGDFTQRAHHLNSLTEHLLKSKP
jgi:siroheme synthase-like protein